MPERIRCYRCEKDLPPSEFAPIKRYRAGVLYACIACLLLNKRVLRYKITTEDYNNFYKNQNGRCAICREKTPLVIDHNHKTGKVRGLLCYKCNSGIGLLQDKVINLVRAVDYLEGANG